MTAFTNGQQSVLVLQSVLLGAGIGAVYDILRAARLYFRCGRGSTALLDALFWLITLAAMFEFGLLAAAGQPRGFVLIAVGGGMGAYFVLLSGTVIAMLLRLLEMAARLCRICQKAVKQLRCTEKIRLITKKFEKSSFLFRGKGIK